MPDVFISYSRKDTTFVRSLHRALTERRREVWVDWEGIAPTAEWLAEIRAAIDAAQAFLFVVSPESVASDVCRQELEHAVAQNKRLVPIVCLQTDQRAVPAALARLNWIFFRESDDFGAAVDQLERALDTDLDWVRAHTRLLVRAKEWEARGRDASQTLRGSELKAAEQWLIEGVSKQPGATPLHTEYIVASRRSATRRQRIQLGAVSFGLVVAVALAVLAYFQWQSARSREVAAHADAQLDTDPELAVLLAREAANVAHTTQAREVLRRALLASHLIKVLRGHTGGRDGLVLA